MPHKYRYYLYADRVGIQEVCAYFLDHYDSTFPSEVDAFVEYYLGNRLKSDRYGEPENDTFYSRTYGPTAMDHLGKEAYIDGYSKHYSNSRTNIENLEDLLNVEEHYKNKEFYY